MFNLSILWLALLLLFSLLAFLKKKRFRGFMIPSRICYGLLLVNEIWLTMQNDASEMALTMLIVAIVFTLILVDLLEIGFRNKLQNRLSVRLMLVTSAGFVLTLLSLVLAISLI